MPSVILTMLVGERVTAWDADERYKDLPTALKTMLGDLDRWLQLHPVMPPLEDPSCPGTYFNHRWNQPQYENFRNKISMYAAWVSEAYDEPDQQRSLAAWQRVFGTAFKAPALAATVAQAGPSPAGTTEKLARAPKEQFIEELFTPVRTGHTVRISATVEKKDGFRSGALRQFRSVGKQRSLRFNASTDVPRPFDLYWKVRNTGPEAAGQLRGELLKDAGSMSRTETTLYRGRHYVEVYVVKDGRVVAMDRHDVVID